MKSLLKSLLLTEYKALYDFFAVAFIIGILGSFFGIHLSYIFLIPALIILGFILLQKRGKFLKPAIFLLFMGLAGIGITQYRLNQASAPVLEKPLYNVEMSGKIQEVTHLPESQKIAVSDIHYFNHLFESAPDKLYLTYFERKPFLHIGDTIRFRADIRPPKEPVYWGTYHEARTLYFEGVGGIGKIQEILSVQKNPSSLQNTIENVRTQISNRLEKILPDEPARVAIPLTIGEQHIVTKELYDMFRSAGVVHILSISGFHLSLLAIFVFFVVRGLLSFFPLLSERISAKKTAAVLALFAVMGYILISGMHIPAIRSFIMIAFVLTAVLLDRTALSIRSLSIAAVLILFYRPDFIFSIGFQLSFTAVLILVTLCQPFERHFLKNLKSTKIGKLIRIILGFALASLFITSATTPLILYHFNQYAPYGILGNVLTGLIISFWIMPCLFLGLLMMPIGWDILFFKMAGIGISYVTAICDKIHHWPNALIRLPSYDTLSLCLMMLGIILICMMKTKLRFIGILIFLIGTGNALWSPKENILIADKGQTIAIREEDGHLRFLSAAPHSQAAKIWCIKNGEDPIIENLPKVPPDLIHLKKKRISLTPETCSKADFCLNHLHKNQVYLIYISDKIKVKTP